MPSSIEVTTENHSHTIEPIDLKLLQQDQQLLMILTFKGGLGVTNWRVCVAKPLNEISKSQMWMFVQSKSKKEKKSVNSEFACDHVSKLQLKLAIDLGLNLIVKILILYSEFVLP